MGILDFIFKPKPPPEEATYEIVERHLSIDSLRYKVRVKKGGREFYAEELFQGSQNPEDLKFSRFFVLEEKPVLPHFAPSLPDALDWFNGRKYPKDGYNTIWWGDRFTYECTICQAKRVVPLKVTQVERLTVASAVPAHREIVGWRVAEVETELTGKGIPTKRVDGYKTLPVVKWHNFPNRYLCSDCARKLAEVGRGSEVADAFIFEMK
jgi:DNA-directed RNA polymerase subunit RPC12/RpoP